MAYITLIGSHFVAAMGHFRIMMHQHQSVPGPASLTVWPSDVSIKAAEPRELPSLQEALNEALKALNEGTGTPWVTTSDGLILSPAHLRGMQHSARSLG